MNKTLSKIQQKNFDDFKFFVENCSSSPSSFEFYSSALNVMNEHFKRLFPAFTEVLDYSNYEALSAMCEKVFDDPIFDEYSKNNKHRVKNGMKSYMNMLKAKSYFMDTHKRMSKNQQYIQKIFFGTPGGGKSHKVKQIIKDEGATERCFRTTFHSDTDYASFVGSYKPVMDGKEIIYQFIPQIFTNAYVAAWNDPKNDYYLVIEEINRGNCAQIFGDLFQLLDRNADGFSEYGIVADADLRKYLETAVDEDGNLILINKQGIHKGELLLPPNFSILATMNTSDQSLFPMDSAFKRRWAWEFVPSTYKEDDNYELTFGDKAYKWHDFLDAVNPRIKEATDSEDKQLGAYFIKSDMDAEEFKSKVMYYLWSEICKDEYKTRNNFFRHKVGDKSDVEFTFNELYTDGPKDATLLNEFMEYLKIGEQ